MKKIIKKILSFITILSILGIIFLALYILSRIIIFYHTDYGPIDNFFGLLLLTAEGFIAIHSLNFLLGIIRIPTSKYRKENLQYYPSVAVVVAARHEPKEILNKTFITLKLLKYPNKNLYFLDDSSEDIFRKEALEICERHGAKIFSREERHGAKAGIINDFLKQMSEEYIAIFDADQNPMPNFLIKTMPYFEQDPKLAFVQTPQFYTNVSVSPIARGACIQQEIFYGFICANKESSNSMFCCGTNVVFKKKALVSVGGFDESSITEDFATSIKLHLKGHTSIYHNHVLAFGMAPESLPAYFKQQSRWATGSIQVFKKVIKNMIQHPHKLTFIQWWEYLISSSYYFTGIAFFILMMAPILYLLFNIPSFFTLSSIYLTIFIPYFVLVLIIFYGSMYNRKFKIIDLYFGTILGMISFPILIKSIISGLTGKKVKFVVTTKGKADKLPFLSLWPYHIMMILCVLAMLIGSYRLINTTGDHAFAIGVNLFWTLYHFFILSNIHYFNKRPILKNE